MKSYRGATVLNMARMSRELCFSAGSFTYAVWYQSDGGICPVGQTIAFCRLSTCLCLTKRDRPRKAMVCPTLAFVGAFGVVRRAGGLCDRARRKLARRWHHRSVHHPGHHVSRHILGILEKSEGAERRVEIHPQ